MKIKLFLTCVAIALSVGTYFLYLHFKPTVSRNDDADVKSIQEAIKKTEAEQPARIGTSPTEEQINESPYIRNIRTALNAYLDGTNTGIEDSALNEVEGMDCGLNRFDKSYYKSNFVIAEASDGDYGGVQAYIIFIDKPDTLFWTWVYRLGGDGEYVLRAFCSNGPDEDKKDDFQSYVTDLIKNAKYQY